MIELKADNALTEEEAQFISELTIAFFDYCFGEKYKMNCLVFSHGDNKSFQREIMRKLTAAKGEK